MFAIHRDYVLQNQHHFHAHFQVNPIGKLEFEILESHERHDTTFHQLSFERYEGQTKVLGYDEDARSGQWQLLLNEKDADELNQLVELAREEYEILMNDLM
ncbi:hypothetical protein EK599_21640 [Vibrio sp. T187]|uniref:hypothetical protein n=1 Tax=Vibrio TaxID=662 RepID=UPI0010C9DF43|nr:MULTISPECIES: hypothetical protein [Vibrio]MBW3698281.1 hypothetical protein [Vibrio sp. T187]